MNVQKFSISLPQQQCDFIESYQTEHHYKSRSEVIKKALYLLQQMQLESCYLEANEEIDHTFDATASDGIENDETW
ncbi:ribbon-helix-helix domain-containing protein [Thiotrichales bacterium 19S9-12]|nr:ribbon-helix-helix domain-containing protein [Thiotrichales bacterium 19S9-11]MCF6811698.1 ribbon-helix-helix domain-containing protein [Thiotrichales bacterium 19S9-12]